jgi:hypothetical protein
MTIKEILDLQYKNLNEHLIELEQHKLQSLLIQRNIKELRRNIKYLTKEINKNGHTK